MSRMICEKCRKSLVSWTENLQCVICEKFSHSNCVGIADRKLYSLVVSNRNLSWTCDGCLVKSSQLKHILAMEESVEKLEEKVNRLLVDVRQFDEEEAIFEVLFRFSSFQDVRFIFLLDCFWEYFCPFYYSFYCSFYSTFYLAAKSSFYS